MKNSHQTKNRANILVVDDDLGVQRMMRRILGRSGYNVLVAGGGQEARRQSS